ncbi:MAG: translation initiation factor IF-2 [Saprospiraceae bacterium]|nr:translation initiation factor IF-2 [Candidatus Brachybacter algidus]
MAKKQLIQVVRELSVGMDTIYDHLVAKGFELEKKPNAKLTDDMYDAVLVEFQSDLAIKNKAEQMSLGPKPMPKKEEKVEPVVVAVKPVVIAPPVEEIIKTPEPVKEVVVEDPPKEEPRREEHRHELKVVGKIDLDDLKRKKKPVEPKSVEPEPEPEPVKAVIQEEVKPIEPEIKEEVVEVKTSVPEAASDNVPEGPASTESRTAGDGMNSDEMFRAKSPTLKGLKILGKIDTEKMNKPVPKKKEDPRGTRPGQPGTPANAAGTGTPGENLTEEQKRKRKRKKLPVNTGGGNMGQSNSNYRGPGQGQGQNQGGQGQGNFRRGGPEPVKEVSQKEIEDKIKSTMARLNSGGKNKRSKVRRDKRDVHREKSEALELARSTEKIQVTEFISVSELASLMNVPAIQVITTCMNLGVMVSINQRLNAEIIELVASEFDHEIEFISAEDDTDFDEEDIVDAEESLEPRAPIITVMGHVDHGKTSLLDFIRKANVASGEAGGITQHIGAYEVVINEKKIVFLDTPGHEAFTAMRARGAKITDVAVIIIASDDNIMPQTKEAISHAQAAGVPIIFAINKIDKPGADPEKIKGELAQMNLLVEDWGGKYQSQDISSKTGENIEQLLEKILLEAEVLDLKANPNRVSIGTVIEASLDKGRGYVTKILVQNGTLNQTDYIVAGEYSGRVKAMFNERGKKVKTAGPSTPVLVLGLSGAPQAGEKFKEFENEGDARQIAARRAQINREQTNRATRRISLDDIGRRLALGTFKELNLIVKGDVDGSIEALADSLIKLSVETVQVNVIHKAVGQIIESDVLLASASDAIIIGFQVRPSLGARKAAEKEGVQIKSYSIIYEAINEVKAAMEGMLEPTKEEKFVGQVAVREVYKISKVGTVIGGYVEEGKITRNTFIRVVRDGIVVFPTKENVHGEIATLKRFKADVKEVKAGFECGLTIKNFNDIKEGDSIEGYEITEVKQTLS